MFGLAAIPAILMFVGMLFQHESPHWLIAHGREDEAREVLHRVRTEGDIERRDRPRSASCPSASRASARCSARRSGTS